MELKKLLAGIEETYNTLQANNEMAVGKIVELKSKEDFLVELSAKLDSKEKDVCAKLRIADKYENLEEAKARLKKTQNDLRTQAEEVTKLKDEAKKVIAQAEVDKKAVLEARTVVNNKIALVKEREQAVIQREKALKTEFIKKLEKELGK